MYTAFDMVENHALGWLTELINRMKWAQITQYIYYEMNLFSLNDVHLSTNVQSTTSTDSCYICWMFKKQEKHDKGLFMVVVRLDVETKCGN